MDKICQRCHNSVSRIRYQFHSNARVEGDVETGTTYIQPDQFFALPIYTENGVVKVDGKALGFGGKHLTAKKYVNGPVG